MSEAPKMPTDELLRMTAQVTAAYVGNNAVDAATIPEVIRSIYQSIAGLESGQSNGHGDLKPMVPIKKSITPDYIICLEDGKKLRMLKRHLRAAYNLTPEQYRAKWGLPVDYPMVAPNYAEQRSAIAKKIGLGRKPSASPRRNAKTKRAA